MEGYNVTIIESSQELTARERIMMKDTSNAIRLDEATNGDTPVIITPSAYAVLSIHNDKSENKDYYVYVVVDCAGNKFATGSQSFWESFKEIWNEMETEEEEYSVEVYRKDSKNYKGKQFLTCSIV